VGLVYVPICFADFTTHNMSEKKWKKWVQSHLTLYFIITWIAESAYLLWHWFFNWRYVKSTLRLPVLKKSAEFFNKMLDRILKQREEQFVIFTAVELEKHHREVAELKDRQRSQENWSNAIEAFFLLLVAVSGWPYIYYNVQANQEEVHFAHKKTTAWFNVPMFFLLNVAMLIAVIFMRYMIKSMPNMFPNENLIIVHVFLFSLLTIIWIVHRVAIYLLHEAQQAFDVSPTIENDLNLISASKLFVSCQAAWTLASNVLSFFMLFMLHKFSVFTGFVTDPLTGLQVPVLSMF